MNKNLEIVENWYTSFKNYKKLSLMEAQNIYLKMKIQEDSIEKNKLKDELILGTLYVVYEQLKTSSLLYLNLSMISMEDIINTSCEVWIEFLLNGNLLKINYYSAFFKQTFYEKIAKKIWPESFSIYTVFKMEENKLLKGIAKYILFRKNNQSLSLETIKEILNVHYECFEQIYSVIEKSGILAEKEISERQLIILTRLLIAIQLEVPFNFKDKEDAVMKKETSENELFKVEKEMLIKRVRETYQNVKLPSQRNQEIFERCCGYHTEKTSLEELLDSGDYPSLTTHESIRFINNTTRKRLLHQNRYVPEWKEIYNELIR